mgnify:CR=1 FL=1
MFASQLGTPIDADGMRSNVALTLRIFASELVTVHVPVPVHPDHVHPVNTDPASGVAVRVTEPFKGTRVEHIEPQLMSPPVTIPVPVPFLLTLTLNAGSNCAVTVVFADAIILQIRFVPEHPFIHPTNIDVGFEGVATIVSGLSLGTLIVHVDVQLVPSVFTTPLAAPAFTRVSDAVPG